jgi:hypothetical protein
VRVFVFAFVFSLFGDKCFAPLRSMVEQFSSHHTHNDDSDLNLSGCIRMLVMVLTLRYYYGGGESFALLSFSLLSFSPVRVCLFMLCLNPLYYDGGCCPESNLCLTHTLTTSVKSNPLLSSVCAKEKYFALLSLSYLSALICVS